MESSEPFSIPIDILDDQYLLYEPEPPFDDELARNLQGEIDGLTLDLIERDKRIQELREAAPAHNQPWWTN